MRHTSCHDVPPRLVMLGRYDGLCVVVAVLTAHHDPSSITVRLYFVIAKLQKQFDFLSCTVFDIFDSKNTASLKSESLRVIKTGTVRYPAYGFVLAYYFVLDFLSLKYTILRYLPLKSTVTLKRGLCQ